MLYIHFVLQQQKKISFEAKQTVVDFLKKNFKVFYRHLVAE